jgi:hypothetical protein
MSQSILNALKTRLTADAGLIAIVSSRIYLDVGPSNAALPLLVYRAENYRIDNMNTAKRHTMDVVFQFFFANSGTQDIHSAASALSAALASPLTVTGFDRAVFIRAAAGVPSFADDSWTIQESYRVTAFDI